jgi:hypothetical protein
VVHLDCAVEGSQLRLTGSGCRPARIGAAGRSVGNGRAVGHFRSEAADLVTTINDATLSEDALLIDGDVSQVSFPGGFWRHVVETAAGQLVVDSGTPIPAGTHVAVRVPAEALFVFAAPRS